METILMITGFALAAYSVVGNDVIQTLGTFLSSNEKREWYVLWAYIATILIIVLLYGWFAVGDVSYGRLSEVPVPEEFKWYFILPPLILMIITRLGVPVSTTFLILSVFSEPLVEKMVEKSVWGYVVAFSVAAAVYAVISRLLEKHFIHTEITPREQKIWMSLQWCSTGFLWSQWLIQDLANIYVYLPREMSDLQFILTIVLLLVLLAYIFYRRGGAVQKVVTSKTNTADVRSATIIDFLYGFILLIFTELNNIPMSTTWVFVGLLAGREYMISFMLKDPSLRKVTQVISLDLFKVFSGLIVSLALSYLLAYLA
ncbi:MAG: hypothetical protein SF052_27835 [Bacteroidia bacterium]|nr:hypothetical protein [Bacteroidia bacterium]